MKRLARWAASLVVLTGVGLVGYWSGRTVGDRPIPLANSGKLVVTYTAKIGELKDVQSAEAVGHWEVRSSLRAQASGIVTRAPASGLVADGQSLLSVNETPVLAVVADIPFYRELRAGSRGDDVRNLQGFLARQGFFSAIPDGVFASATKQAVRDWQKALGTTVSGVVPEAALIAISASGIVLRPRISVGEMVTAGQEVADILEPEPRFALLGTDAGPPRPQSKVALGGNSEWRAQVGEGHQTVDGIIQYALDPVDGTTICGSNCMQVALNGTTTFPATLVITPPTKGVVVPVSALRQNSSGVTVVQSATGDEIHVEVTAAVNGLAVVTGLHDGATILLPSAISP